LEIESHILPRQTWPQSSHFSLPIQAGMTGMCHHAQLFFLGLTWNCDAPSTSQVTRIIDMSHCDWLFVHL
jgi:hypothetical protein